MVCVSLPHKPCPPMRTSVNISFIGAEGQFSSRCAAISLTHCSCLWRPRLSTVRSPMGSSSAAVLTTVPTVGWARAQQPSQRSTGNNAPNAYSFVWFRLARSLFQWPTRACLIMASTSCEQLKSWPSRYVCKRALSPRKSDSLGS